MLHAQKSHSSQSLPTLERQASSLGSTSLERSKSRGSPTWDESMEAKIQELLARHDVTLRETYMAAIRSGPDVLQTPSRGKGDVGIDMEARTAPGGRPKTVAGNSTLATEPEAMHGRNNLLMQRPPSRAAS